MTAFLAADAVRRGRERRAHVTDDDSTGLDSGNSTCSICPKRPEGSSRDHGGGCGQGLTKCSAVMSSSAPTAACARRASLDSSSRRRDDDLSELYENVSRSRSGRDGASVISDAA